MTTLQPTLIMSSRYTEDSQQLWNAAIKRGWNVERIHGWRVPDHLRRIQEPIIYMEALLAPTIAQEFGITLLEPPDDWLPLLPAEYRQRDVQLTTLAQARTLTARRFVKPPNDKSFPARVYEPADLPDFPEGTPVLVAEVVEWEKEFRCFILNRQLYTFSIYLRNGVLQHEDGFITSDAEAKEAASFVEKLLQDKRVQLSHAIVLDVGVIRERGWAVIEVNAAWGAGIYGCDPDKVLDVIHQASQR